MISRHPVSRLLDIDPTFEYQKDQLLEQLPAGWVPKAAGRRILELLRQYGYANVDLLKYFLSVDRKGKGLHELSNHLTRLRQYGYVDRYRRPTHIGKGSGQFVYTLSPKGAQLLLRPEELLRIMPILEQRLSTLPKIDLQLQLTFLHMLWDLSVSNFPEGPSLIRYWQEGDLTEYQAIRGFSVKVSEFPLCLRPHSVAVVRVYPKGDSRFSTYHWPIFFELLSPLSDRTVTANTFRAYQALVTNQAHSTAKTFERVLGIRVERGMVVFLCPNADFARDSLELARDSIAPHKPSRTVPGITFMDFRNLFERTVARDSERNSRLIVERPLTAADLLRKRITRSVDGRLRTLLPS